MMEVQKCSTCKDAVNEVRQLSPSHTFCRNCVEQSSENSQPEEVISCCDNELQAPEVSSAGAVKNAPIAAKATKKKQASPRSHVSSTEPPSTPRKHMSTSPSFTYASYHAAAPTGRSFLDDSSNRNRCESLQISSSLSSPSIRRSHSIHGQGRMTLSMEQLSAEGSQLAAACCPIHEDKKIELFCHDCSQPICALCVIEKHVGHRCCDIAKINPSQRQQICYDFTAVASCLDQCHQAREILARGRDDYLELIDRIRTEVFARAETLHMKIEQDKDHIANQLSNAEAFCTSDIDAMAKLFYDYAQLISGFEKQATRLSETATSLELTPEISSLRNKTSELISFDFIENALNVLNSNDINFTPANISANMIGDVIHNRTMKALVSDGSKKMPSVLLKHVIFKGNGKPIYAVTTLNNQIYAVRSKSPEIDIYSAKTFKLEGTISLSRNSLVDLRGLASCQTNSCVYVADLENVCVHRIGVGMPANVRKLVVTQWSVIVQPTGVAVSNNKTVLVTCSQSNRIKEFTTRGSPIRTFCLSPDIGCPWHCVQTPSGYFVVTHSCPTRGISVLDSEGRLVRSLQTFIDANGAESTMNTPRCVTVSTWTGCVLVADYRRILVVDSSLCTVRELPLVGFSNLKQPYDVCMEDLLARLYVVERSRGRIMVFDNINVIARPPSDDCSSSEFTGGQLDRHACGVE